MKGVGLVVLLGREVEGHYGRLLPKIVSEPTLKDGGLRGSFPLSSVNSPWANMGKMKPREGEFLRMIL